MINALNKAYKQNKVKVNLRYWFKLGIIHPQVLLNKIHQNNYYKDTQWKAN
jgi:hypothetical protein